MPSDLKRKLAAIMFTDMVGYTALMQKDEPKARELIERQREILTPLVIKHDGEVLQYVGDGTFCTFNSAIEAVNCAIEIQIALLTEEGISLRIGIHVGDVVVKGDEVYGDGVNVASRLEPLAEPGGICISGKVYDDVRNKPDIEVVFVGNKSLKNVDHLLEVYAISGSGLPYPGIKGIFLQKLSMKHAFLYGGIGVLLIVLIVVGFNVLEMGERLQNYGRNETAIRQPFRFKQVTFDKGVEEYPTFSPDGLHLAYSGEVKGYRQIFFKNLESGEKTKLTSGSADNIQTAWSPDGENILFVRSNQPNGKLEPGDIFGVHSGGDIWMVDLESGKEIKILDDAFNPSYSPDGHRIAFDASWAGPRRIWISDNLGRNPQQVSFDSSESVDQIMPKWSPDGSNIVFQNKEGTKFDIKVIDIFSKKMKWITNDRIQELNPVWSQSGKVIYFSSYRSGGLNIWRVPVSENGIPSGEVQQITTGAGQDVQLTVSTDGRQIAYSILRQNADIWKLPISLETGRSTGDPEEVIVTTREDSRGVWSPDGRMIAFNSDRTGEMNIWLYSIDDGSVYQLTKGPGGDFQPNWSPDGKQLAFFSARSGNADIWLVEVETGDLKQISKNSSLDINPFFSSDGKFIAYQSDQGGRKELWVMNADGTNQRQLTNTGIGGHFMRWSVDKNSIIFISPYDDISGTVQVSLTGGDPEYFSDIRGGAHISFSPNHSMIMDVIGHKSLWVSPVESGDPEKVFEFEDSENRIDYPVWSPDGNWILFDRVKPQGGDIWVIENL